MSINKVLNETGRYEEMKKMLTKTLHLKITGSLKIH